MPGGSQGVVIGGQRRRHLLAELMRGPLHVVDAVRYPKPTTQLLRRVQLSDGQVGGGAAAIR